VLGKHRSASLFDKLTDRRHREWEGDQMRKIELGARDDSAATGRTRRDSHLGDLSRAKSISFHLLL